MPEHPDAMAAPPRVSGQVAALASEEDDTPPSQAPPESADSAQDAMAGQPHRADAGAADPDHGKTRSDAPWSLTAIAERVETSRPFAVVAQHLELPSHLELPRPWRLLRTAAWSLGESIGLPFAAYLTANWAAGQTAGLIAGLAAVWLTTVARKAFTGSVPGLLTISAIMLTVQTGLVLATGATWVYLLQFPIAKFGLSVAFARSARTKQPLVAQLATEVVGLLHPSAHYPGLQRFFQRATWLWSAIFLALSSVMAVWVASEPITVFIFLSSVVTAAVVGAGICVSAVWFWSVLRRLGLRLRFAPA